MIGNIHFLFPSDDDSTIQIQATRKDTVSQHIVMKHGKKYVFGWDQPLQSFFLQVHDLTLSEDTNPIIWLGATVETRMYEVEDLFKAAQKHDIMLSYETRAQLYAEKDDGR